MRQTSILEVNEFLVLDFVRAEGATTRPEISASLGLSASSVSRIVRRLEGEGLVSEGESTPSGGRPRVTITFNTRAGCVMGVDLGGTKCHGALADLAGTVLDEDVRPTASDGSPLQTLIAVIDSLLATSLRHGLPLAAIAIGVPAIVQPEIGVATGGPNVQWHGFPVYKELATRLGVPFMVQNDVKLAALAHAWRGDGRAATDFAVLSIGTGIGAALVLDGRLANGHHNAAGEVGYLLLSRDQVRDTHPDGLGGLERLASGPAIADRARGRIAMSAAPSLLRESPVTPEAVFAAARAGDAIAKEIVDELCDHVAMGIVALSTVGDPEVLILEGSVGRALEPFLARVDARVRPLLPFPPTLVVASLGENATVLGAIAAALELARHRRAPSAFASGRQVGRSGTRDVNIWNGVLSHEVA